jgi:hypothetical protein
MTSSAYSWHVVRSNQQQLMKEWMDSRRVSILKVWEISNPYRALLASSNTLTLINPTLGCSPRTIIGKITRLHNLIVCYYDLTGKHF